jgi:hypothetical protein
VPRVADLSGARGHRTREPRWGDGAAASCRRRGAPTRIAPSGRGRRRASRNSLPASGGCGGHESCRRQDGTPARDRSAAGRGGGQGRTPSHPRDQHNSRHAVTKQGRPRIRGARKNPAVTERPDATRAATQPPRGGRTAPAVGDGQPWRVRGPARGAPYGPHVVSFESADPKPPERLLSRRRRSMRRRTKRKKRPLASDWSAAPTITSLTSPRLSAGSARASSGSSPPASRGSSSRRSHDFDIGMSWLPVLSSSTRAPSGTCPSPRSTRRAARVAALS